mmetsp:Transcript_86793/g.201963  ORF Transcript_86793/g.201963 Transcript_86793/m.201963 type:complete len:237 (+) Transcript_86793:96-806(+)
MRSILIACLCLGVGALRTKEDSHLQPMDESRPGACACLNWQDVFESGLAQCGDGGELISTGRNLPADKEFCNSQTGSAFYLNQNHEMCINFEKVSGPRKVIDGSWCYVAASCSELRGGSKLTDKVNWKICSGKDPQLSKLPPAKLFEIGHNSGKSLTMMALMAYTWNEVKGLLPRPPTAKEVVQLVAGEVGLIPVPNKTALTRKQPENTITWKGQTWEVHPTKALCVEGCEEGVEH